MYALNIDYLQKLSNLLPMISQTGKATVKEVAVRGDDDGDDDDVGIPISVH